MIKDCFLTCEQNLVEWLFHFDVVSVFYKPSMAENSLVEPSYSLDLLVLPQPNLNTPYIPTWTTIPLDSDIATRVLHLDHTDDFLHPHQKSKET